VLLEGLERVYDVDPILITVPTVISLGDSKPIVNELVWDAVSSMVKRRDVRSVMLRTILATQKSRFSIDVQDFRLLNVPIFLLEGLFIPDVDYKYQLFGGSHIGLSIDVRDAEEYGYEDPVTEILAQDFGVNSFYVVDLNKGVSDLTVVATSILTFFKDRSVFVVQWSDGNREYATVYLPVSETMSYDYGSRLRMVLAKHIGSVSQQVLETSYHL